MTPDEIRTKCRKVYLTTQDNRIFWPCLGGYYQEIKVFQAEDKADQQTRHHQQLHLETFSRANSHTAPTIYHKTVAFYLVPASKIDDEKL